MAMVGQQGPFFYLRFSQSKAETRQERLTLSLHIFFHLVHRTLYTRISMHDFVTNF